jgi:transcription elongation factor Elf1
MNKFTTKTVEKLHERMKCRLEDCGTHVVLSATQDYLDNIAEAEQVYAAHCTKCNTTFKLKQPELHVFENHFGKPTLNIRATTFKSLFEEE